MKPSIACYLSIIALWGGFFGAHRHWTAFAVCAAVLIVAHGKALLAGKAVQP